MSGVVHAASMGSAGRVSGQLLNGSHNNAPVANQGVTLQMAQGNNSRDLVTITTDAQGHYTFGALESDSSVQYAVYTLYQGAQYFTNLIDLSKNANQQVNLTVYDATTSTANLAVVQASILLDKPNQQSGMLNVSEDFFFENLSDTTYVGTVGDSRSKPNALRFSLPPDARFLTLATGFNGYTGTQVDTGFASNAAVPPGTSEFSFSFQVPYSGNSYHFTYKTLYPTVALSLLTPTNILTTAPDLTSKGPTNTQSGTYQMFQGKTLTANTSFGVQLAGLPVPTKAAPQQQDTFNTGLLWLVALLIVLMILCGIGGYVYTTRKRQAANARQKQIARKGATTAASKKAAASVTKESLLQELLELDKAYEAGKLKKAAYQEQRARLRNRLRPFMNEQPEKRGEAAKQTANGSGKGEK
jgi:5-hydroxyisourate hydrolase-like protein (transthyretin family)